MTQMMVDSRRKSSALSQLMDKALQGWRCKIVQFLETVQDLIVVSLCLSLFSLMVLQLHDIVVSLFADFQFHAVTADILFILILVELFRLLIIYLQEQRISIEVAVEVAIVSVLREVIVRGVLEVEPYKIFAACGLLMVMGGLLVVRAWMAENMKESRMALSHRKPCKFEG